jgi:hypothetical protein
MREGKENDSILESDISLSVHDGSFLAGQKTAKEIERKKEQVEGQRLRNLAVTPTYDPLHSSPFYAWDMSSAYGVERN